MTCNLNLQRDSKIFISTVDIDSGALVTAMTPANTWELEVLAGFATSQASATQEISTLESGNTPDRSIKQYNTSINPVEWSFQTYLRPTGVESIHNPSGNVKPVADWFLWQAVLSNAAPAISGAEHSAWENKGKFGTAVRATSANVAAHSPNFATAQELNMYVKMDNIVYQISKASVNEGSVDAAIDGIATTNWSGFGTDFIELTGTKRNNAISVFGGILNDGTSVASNSNVNALTATASYHTWASYNANGTVTSASFIKNRLSTINVSHTPENSSAVSYVFPVTALSWTINNNITFLTPEELGKLNIPIGNFSGSRRVTSSFSAYLRHGDAQSARLLREIVNDSRVDHSTVSNANIQVGGGTTGPFVAFYHPAVQFEFPTHDIEDVIGITVNFQAQEPSSSCGAGGEVEIHVKKS